MAAGIASVIPYSADYKEQIFGHGEAYFSIRIDYDFAMSIPGMESRLYYRKDLADNIKQRLNALGIWLLFKYDIETQGIKAVTVKFDAGCMTEYIRQQDIERIVSMVIQERAKQ